MSSRNLYATIKKKQKELDKLVLQKQSLQNSDVYNKSCELDILVVAHMRLHNSHHLLSKCK